MQIVTHKCQITPKMFVERVFVQTGGSATDGQTTHKFLLLKCGWAGEIQENGCALKLLAKIN